jgi:PleD family two-component response regulator
VFNNPESEKVRAHDILHFSYELTQLTRNEDCVGRLGVNEVVIIVRDGDQNAGKFLQRLLTSTSLTVNHSLLISMGIVFSHRDEDALKLLDRLDKTELVSH